MGEILTDIIKEIIKFIFGVILGWFLFWTGETVFTLVSIGFHSPRWSGYSGTGSIKWVFADAALMFLGFTFWLITFPKIYNLIFQS